MYVVVCTSRTANSHYYHQVHTYKQVRIVVPAVPWVVRVVLSTTATYRYYVPLVQYLERLAVRTNNRNAITAGGK